MQGLGFDNGIFNIEMMYDAEADRISIIEINPRMASQFADLYEKVDGTNSFSVLLDIAQGRTAALHAPAGTLRICRELRVAQFRGLIWSRPCRARPISSASRELYPDIRVELHATPGRKLSDEFQDGKSYRYGVLNLGGRDLADVLEQFESCRAELGIELRPFAASRSPRRTHGGNRGTPCLKRGHEVFGELELLEKPAMPRAHSSPSRRGSA